MNEKSPVSHRGELEKEGMTVALRAVLSSQGVCERETELFLTAVL